MFCPIFSYIGAWSELSRCRLQDIGLHTRTQGLQFHPVYLKGKKMHRKQSTQDFNMYLLEENFAGFFLTACGDESHEMRQYQQLFIFSGEISSVECVNSNVKQCLLNFVYY